MEKTERNTKDDIWSMIKSIEIDRLEWCILYKILLDNNLKIRLWYYDRRCVNGLVIQDEIYLIDIVGQHIQKASSRHCSSLASGMQFISSFTSIETGDEIAKSIIADIISNSALE